MKKKNYHETKNTPMQNIHNEKKGQKRESAKMHGKKNENILNVSITFQWIYKVNSIQRNERWTKK